MGRFQAKYRPEQREAVVRAITGEGEHGPMSAQQAVDAAARGELGLPAFTFTKATAQHYAQKRRRELEEAAAKVLSRQPVDKSGPEHLAKLMDAIGVEVLRVQRASEAGKVNPSRIGALARAIGDIAAAERKLRPEQPRPQKGKTEQQAPETTGPSLMDKLAAAEKTRKRKPAPEQTNAHPHIGEDGEGEAGPSDAGDHVADRSNGEQESSTTDHENGRLRSRDAFAHPASSPV